MLQQDNNFFGSTKGYVGQAKFRDFNQIKSSNRRPFLAKVINSPPTSDTTARSNNPTPAVNEELLFVEQNDVVTIEECLDEKWFLARSEQQYGRLAVGCCQVLDDIIPMSFYQYIIENQYYNLHVCFASFVAQDVGDLSITKGDIIVSINQVNEHWMQGQVCFDSQGNRWPKLAVSQQVGTFPLNHCWQLSLERVKEFCHEKVESQKHQHDIAIPKRSSFITTAAHSSSLSSGSSSHQSSSDYHHNQQQSIPPPPPRPQQLPRQAVQLSQPSTATSGSGNSQPQRSSSLLTIRQQDKLKGLFHTIKKKTARLSTRITASLGLISLTRDEEFERHYEKFKHIEKTIRIFIKNLTTFVEHFENFLLSLQNTSENLADFYRDKSHQKELEELRRKNKALACEHFHAFKRTVDRQVIAVASQLLQKFTVPHQLVSKRSAKLLDFDNRAKEMESCRDLEKKAALRDQYVIAKDLYDRINRQLIEELPLFNQLALDIFKECVLVLLESRRNLIISYAKHTASLLNTPLMMTYTASDVASSILMSCDLSERKFSERPIADMSMEMILEQKNRKDSGQTSGHDTRQNSGNDDELSRPQSAASQLSSEFNRMALIERDISSTPLSQISEPRLTNGGEVVKFDEPDGAYEQQGGDEEDERNSVPKRNLNVSNSDEGIQSAKRSLPPKERRKRKFQIYVASWPFVAIGPNQLTITCKQPLKLIKGCDECGNPDWSLVQDKKGQLGYVPSSYIKKKSDIV